MAGTLELAAEHARLACGNAGFRTTVTIAIQAFLRLRDGARAAQALAWAAEHDVPEAMVAPLAAGLAFLEGRVDEMRSRLQRLPSLSRTLPQVAGTLALWSNRGSAS
jgi:hypothetical protein